MFILEGMTCHIISLDHVEGLCYGNVNLPSETLQCRNNFPH